MWSQADDAGAKQSVGGVQQRLMQAHTAIFAVLRAVGQDFALSRQAVGFAWMLRALQVGAPVHDVLSCSRCACLPLTRHSHRRGTKRQPCRDVAVVCGRGVPLVCRIFVELKRQLTSQSGVSWSVT
jgi:hypothetical protein